MGIICQGGSSLENPIWLKEEIILNEADVDFHITDIRRLGQKGIVLGALMDDSVYFYSFETQKVSLLTRKGQGPGEINGGYGRIDIFNNEIYIRATDFVVSSFNENGFLRIKYNPPFSGKKGNSTIYPHSWVPGDNSQIAYGAYTTFDKHDEPYSLAVLKNNSGIWHFEGPVSIEDLPAGTGQEHARFRRDYAGEIRLIQAYTPGFFYRIPLILSREIEVRDQNGQLVRTIMSPNPAAKAIPVDLEDKVDFYSNMDGNQPFFLLWSPARDGAGNLHVMLPKYSVHIDGKKEKRNYQYIFSYSEQGVQLKVCRSRINVKQIAPSFDGKSYYAIDIHGNVGHLTPE